MTRDEIPENIINLVNEVVELLNYIGDWPDDYWLTLSDNFDLNLWSEETFYNNFVTYADIYSVEDGFTTDNFYTFYNE